MALLIPLFALAFLFIDAVWVFSPVSGPRRWLNLAAAVLYLSTLLVALLMGMSESPAGLWGSGL